MAHVDAPQAPGGPREPAKEWMKGKLCPDVKKVVVDSYLQARAESAGVPNMQPKPSIPPPQCLIELGYCGPRIVTKTYREYHEITHQQVRSFRAGSIL